AKGLELALEYDSQSKLEDLSYDELCHGMEHYCRKALNKTRILCPSGTESGNLGIEIEVDHNYENTDLASERKIYDDVYEKYEDLVEIGVDGGENLDEIRSLNSSSKEKQGGFVLDRECQERLTQLSHELSFHPDFRTFETVHINVDSAVNMSAQNSIFNFRNDNGSYWESKEAPVSVVRLHQSKRRMPNLFRMSRYIDQLQLVSALRDVRWRDIGKEELTQIFSEEERAEFSAMLEGDQRPIAKLLIYIADKHDRRDLYAPILRLLAEKSIPSLKSSLMARFFNLCPDPYSQSFLQELARIVTREIEAIGETDEETDNQLAYLNEVVGTRNIKDSPALRALMVDTSINANAREIIFRNCGEIDPVTLFDPELELYCFEDESVLSPNEGDHETILKRIRENPDPDRLEDILSLIAKEVSFSLEDPNLLDFIKDESIDEEVRDLVIEQLIAPVSTGLVERLGLDLKKFFDLDRISGSTPISLSPAMVGLINNDCLGKNYKSVLAEKLEGSSGLHYTVAELKAAGIKDPSWLIVNGTNLKLEPNSIDFADMGTERWGWPLTETKGVEVAEALRPISLEELREIHQQETLFERIKFAVTQRFEQKLSFEEAHRHNLDLALLLKADRIKEPIKFSREFRDAIVDLPPSQSSKNPELYRRLIYSLEQPLSHDQFFAFYQKLVDLFHHTSHFGPLAADLISKLEQPINCEELRARNYSPFLFLLADKLTGIVNLDDTAISILEKKSNHPEIQKTLRQAQRRLLSLLESDLELNDQIRDLLGNTKIELEHRLELARKLKDGIDVKTVRRYLADPWILSERIKGIIASKRKSLVERLPTYKL
ncbi:MAG: hypothetical protein OXU45_09780, partial [Candidatus Melainabacteria bacterium]|nr:hypothetical protein [Candidatus Melainabacteria bacterium]